MQGFILFIFSRTFCYPTYGRAPPQGPIPYPVTYHFWQITVEPLLWDTSIQVTPPFGGQKIWSPKNVHIISVFVTSIEGKPLFRGKGHFFWVQTLVSPLFRGHLSNQKVTDDKIKMLCVQKSQWRQTSKHELTHWNRCPALKGIQHTKSQTKIDHGFLYII